jgi:hypothetical protein
LQAVVVDAELEEEVVLEDLYMNLKYSYKQVFIR